MKKIITALFTVGLMTLFTGCLGFWEGAFKELNSDIESIYAYTVDSSNRKTTKVSTSVGGSYEVKCTIQFKSRTDYETNVTYYDTNSNVTLRLESSDENVAKVEWVDTKDTQHKFYNTNRSSGFIEPKFKVIGVGTGDCTIKVQEVGDSEKSCSVSVHVDAEKGIYIVDENGKDIEEVYIVKGTTKQLKYKNTYDSKNPTWSTNNTYTATVTSAGVVKGVRQGVATITLKTYDGKKSDTCTVRVVDPTNCSIVIDESSIPTTVRPGSKFTLRAVVNVSNGMSDKVTWRSENPTVASINEYGMVTANAPGFARIYADLDGEYGISASVLITVQSSLVSCNQFFWGTWTRMDDGKNYEVSENYVTYNGSEYQIISSTASELVVEQLGKFKKESDNYITYEVPGYDDLTVPFFRKGGTNLKYKVRVVGFEDQIHPNYRAAGTGSGISGIKVKGQSEKYHEYTDEGETDANGDVILEAPVQGDTQTLTITDEETGKVVVVPGIKVENDGDNLGTVPWVNEGDYALKVTGTIADKDKTDGYLYGNNYKEYPVTLTITNVSKIKSEMSAVKLSSQDSNLNWKIISPEPADDGSVLVGSMKPGATKTIELLVSYDSFTGSYVDPILDVRVTNLTSERSWVDYVPFRFFAGQMPITVSAKNIENNREAKLKGYIIYPDGNSKFYTVKDNTSTTVYVPVFGDKDINGKDIVYKMVFCGAYVSVDLEDSTEMLYSVNLDSAVASPVPSSSAEIMNAIKWEEGSSKNDTEATAKVVPAGTKNFAGVLDTSDIDFFTITATSASTSVVDR